VEADVVVIGAGYCGISTALHLARHGREVVVLEAFEPGHWASGRNNGHCVPEWLWESPEDVVGLFGRERGERMNHFQAGSAKLVFDLIRENQIECEAVQSGMAKVARNAADATGVRQRVEQWSGRGNAVRFVEGAALREIIVSDVYRAGMLFEEGGHLNPLGYCRGLADAALRAGARIHGQSLVTGVEQHNGMWRVQTGNGSASARTVIMATNAHRSGLRPEVDRSYRQIRAMGLATDPLPLEVRRQVLPGNHNFQEFHARRSWGGGFFFFFDADGRLATGGPIGRGVNATLDQVNGRAAERLQAMFPQLGPVRFTHRWEGFFDVSASRTVGVHELAPRLYAVVGFSGRGIPTATAMGRDLAQMIVEDDVEAMAIPVAPLPRDALGPLAEFLWHDVVLPVNWRLRG
jgi:glycine/D-amino acid oxidase-like deaminating enzyme